MSETVEPAAVVAAPAPTFLSKLKAFVVDAEHEAAEVALAAKHEAETLALAAEKEYKHLELGAVTDVDALLARLRAAAPAV